MDALPPLGEKVLIICKWGHVSDSVLASYAPGEPPLFRPGGLSPGKDVIFWMPMPKEGWHRLGEEQPKENQAALMRNGFGHWNRQRVAQNSVFGCSRGVGRFG